MITATQPTPDASTEISDASESSTPASSTVNIVYRYGLLPPTMEAERVADQMSKAHAYYNRMVELERERRTARDKVLSVGPLLGLDKSIADHETLLLTQRNQKTKDQASIKSLVAALKELRKTRKEALKTLMERPEIKSGLEIADSTDKDAVKAARAACGIYWGTYLQIEAAIQAAKGYPTPPQFHRWTGDGAVSVQLQQGLPLSDLLSTADTRTQLSLNPVPIPGRGGKPLPRLRLRVGSTENRAPIMAKWPIIYHRPLPEGARIKWVKVLRHRTGSHTAWSAHFTMETVAKTPSPTAPGCTAEDILAVNLRWKQVESTTLVADWHDGTVGAELQVHADVAKRLHKSEDLRSIRDKNFDAIRTWLVAQLKLLPHPLNEEHQKRLLHLGLWKAQGKLAAYCLWWRQNRYPSDETLFDKVEAWRKQDKHLWDWEANNRQKALARRRDDYRVFAAKAARRYSTLVIEHLNLAGLAKIPTPDNPGEAQSRSQRTQTAPSELRLALLNAFKREGRTIAKVPAGMTSEKMLLHYREHGGDALVKAPARSNRFNRLRKIPVSPTTSLR